MTRRRGSTTSPGTAPGAGGALGSTGTAPGGCVPSCGTSGGVPAAGAGASSPPESPAGGCVSLPPLSSSSFFLSLSSFFGGKSAATQVPRLAVTNLVSAKENASSSVAKESVRMVVPSLWWTIQSLPGSDGDG